jgi:hypothetical protein
VATNYVSVSVSVPSTDTAPTLEQIEEAATALGEIFSGKDVQITCQVTKYPLTPIEMDDVALLD